MAAYSLFRSLLPRGRTDRHENRDCKTLSDEQGMDLTDPIVNLRVMMINRITITRALHLL
jgi:hypothetical protein